MKVPAGIVKPTTCVSVLEIVVALVNAADASAAAVEHVEQAITPPALIVTGAVALSAPPFVVVAQVAQAIVPVPVIVPPVIGAVVAMLVTVPLPPLALICAVVPLLQPNSLPLLKS